MHQHLAVSPKNAAAHELSAQLGNLHTLNEVNWGRDIIKWVTTDLLEAFRSKRAGALAAMNTTDNKWVLMMTGAG